MHSVCIIHYRYLGDLVKDYVVSGPNREAKLIVGQLPPPVAGLARAGVRLDAARPTN